MSLGAAGCGFEHSNTGGQCGQLTSDLAGFLCSKWRVSLAQHRITGEPFRCAECGRDANRHGDSELAKRRAAETALVRSKVNLV